MQVKRVIMGGAVSFGVVILPAVGNMDALRSRHLWIVFLLGVLASLLQPAYNPFTITKKSGDRATGAQILWTVYLCQLAAVVEAAYLRYPESVRWTFGAVCALAIAVLGLGLRTWAVYALGKHFTMHLELQENHAMITSGPFAFVRHPSYLGAFFMVTGSVAFLGVWYATLITVPALLFAFIRRMHYEEKMLGEHFGDAYVEYRRRVKAFLPWVW